MFAKICFGGRNNTGRSPPEKRVVRRHARLWRDSDGHLEEVRQADETVLVVRGSGYAKPGSVACELRDTGNGYIARFPAYGSCDQDHYVCLDYAEARNLILALTPHAHDLGFAA